METKLLIVDIELHKQLKIQAAKEDKTIRQLTDEIVRSYLLSKQFKEEK